MKFTRGLREGAYALGACTPEERDGLREHLGTCPACTAELLELGAEPVANSPEEFTALVKTEVVKWGDVVKKSGAKGD